MTSVRVLNGPTAIDVLTLCGQRFVVQPIPGRLRFNLGRLEQLQNLIVQSRIGGGHEVRLPNDILVSVQ